MEVHRVLGPGFSEVIYKDALEIELMDHNIPYQRDKPFNALSKDRRLKRRYNADFIVYDSLLLEAKAVESIIDDFVTVAINYLKAADLEVGLIVNFGERSLKYRRVIFTL